MNFFFIRTHFIHSVKNSSPISFIISEETFTPGHVFLLTHVREPFQFPDAFPPISAILDCRRVSGKHESFFWYNLEIVGWIGKMVSCSSLKAPSETYILLHSSDIRLPWRWLASEHLSMRAIKKEIILFWKLATHLQTLRATFPSIGGLLLVVTHSCVLLELALKKTPFGRKKC